MRPSDAARLARIAHASQLYGEAPYMTHVRDVVTRVIEDERATTDAVVVAYLHDVLEDTGLGIHDLKSQGLSQRQTSALMLLTRGESQPYAAYIDHICRDPLAALVKYHDCSSNLEAFPGPHPELEKSYVAAQPRLRDAALGVTECSSCGAAIVFLKTTKGAWMPVDRGSLPTNFDIDQVFRPALGHVTHYATCPNADEHRRRA